MDHTEQFLLLHAKEVAGTITPHELAELRSQIRQFASQRYDVCPVCGGAFSGSLAFEQPFNCPNCGILLTSFASDIVSHQPHEIDSLTPESHSLGKFCGWYIPDGCDGCFCGETFPQSYSCCPSLLVLAVALSRSATGTQKTAALTFLTDHCETLLNCLRGRFAALFDKRATQQLTKLCKTLPFGETLRNVLNEKAA
ncbi:MAG: hypothetical protein ACKO3V_03250 [Pirellula sp.]